MSAFDPNNPETWTIPTNYSGSSCFIDSALWGLLYKIDNPFYQYILSTNFNVDTNSYKLKNFLLAFYGGIHSNSKFDGDDLRDIIGLIRHLFGKLFPTKQQLTDSGKSGTGHHDTTDFFLEMKQIFEKNSSSPNLIIRNTPTMEVIVTANNAPVNNYIPTVTENSGDIISLDSISSIDFDVTPITINGNVLTINYKKQEFNPPIVIREDELDKNNQVIMIPEILNQIETKNPDGTIKMIKKQKDTENSYTSKQVTVTYEYKNNQAIDYLIIPISRVDHNASNDHSKNETKINILEKIGDLHIHSIVVHIGGGPKSGHYVCYFKMRNNDTDEWYLFDDSVEKVTKMNAQNFNELTDKDPNIQKSCAFLFYTTNTNGGANVVNQDEFEKYYTFVNDSKAEYQKNKNQSSLTTSSVPSSTLPKVQTTTPKKTVQTVDKCEKYGEEWLNLFIAKNAAPGSSVEYVENPDGTKTARVKDKKTGIVTSFVAADENCTFVQSNGLTKSATQSQSQSTAQSQSQSTASANQPQSTALQSQTQSQSKQATSKTALAPQVDPLIGQFYVNKDNSRVIVIKTTKDVKYVKDEKITTYKTQQEAINAQSEKKVILDKAADEKKKVAAAAAQAKANAKALLATDEKTKANAALVAAKSKYAGNNEIIQELNKISDVDKIYPDFKITLKNLSFGTVVYNSNDNELYMVVNADIVSKNSKTKSKKFLNLVTDNICNADFKIFTLPDKTKPTYTLTGGTRRKGKKNLRKTNKIRNGKRTKKHIRDKNKLKTNKLRRTRKRNLNKRKTRKVL